MKLALFFAVASVCFGQSASPCISALSAWYLNTGQATNDPAITATPQYKWAYLNPPLTGCLDADGKLQIGASITAGATGPGAYLTSSTSNVLATGNLTFATQAGQAFVSSEYVALISGTGAYAYGPIVSYAGTALVVNVTEIYAGAGATFASWTIVPTGPPGPSGPPGPAGGAGIIVETGCSTAAGCVTLGAATTLDIEPGIGTLCVPQISAASGVMTLQCSSDTAIIAFRVPVPATFPGKCVDPTTNAPYSLGTWAAGSDPTTGTMYSYLCVAPAGTVLPLPPGAPPLIYVWARSPIQTGS